MYSYLLQQRSGGKLSDSLRIPSQTRKIKVSVAAAIASLSLGAAFHTQAAEESAVKASPAQAESSEPAALDSVVVTSRKREELAQDVSIPETIIGGKTLERDNAVTVNDIAQKAPGLLVSATNARQTSIALRGLGKNSANEAIQGSVGIIIDNVVLSQAGMSYSNFIDIEQVELLRGPQGTLQGKNTTLGALNITTKRPSFTPQYAIEAGYGSRNTFDGKASATGPLVDGLLAYRASIYATEGDGQIENIYAPLGNSWQGPRRYGARAQLLLTPSDTLNARLITSFDSSGERTNLSPYTADPTTFATGAARTITYSTRLKRAEFANYTPLIGDVTRDQVDLNSAKPLPVNQAAISLEVNKNIGEYTLTSVSAYRHNDFDFRNDFDYTHFDIQTLSGTVGQTNSFSQELRFASPLGKVVDYQVGLYASKSQSYTEGRALYGKDAGAFYASNAQYAAAAGNTTQDRIDSLNGVYVGSIQNPNAESIAGFGQINWHITDKATLTVGLRETVETVGNFFNKYTTGGVARSTLSTNAQGIRDGQIPLNTLYGIKTPDDQSNSSLSWLINPSYKLNNDVLIYASAGKGVKSGAVQLDNTGNLANVSPEKALDFELGVKSTWLNRQLFLNANLYRTDVTDYQANAQVPDLSKAPGNYVNQLTNIKGVLLRGLEIDGGWSPTNRWNFSFGAAFNDAIYSDYKNGQYAAELNKSGFTDYTGRQLANAPKVTLNFGADYKQPVSENLIGHVFINNVYRSKTNLSSTFSQYTEQEGYSVTNGGFGVATQNGKYELNVVARNLFDTKYAVNKAQYSSTTGANVFWGDARYVGAVFRIKL